MLNFTEIKLLIQMYPLKSPDKSIQAYAATIYFTHISRLLKK